MSRDKQIDSAEIAELVRQIVTRTLGEGQKFSSSVGGGKKRLVLDADTVQQMPVGSVQPIAPDTLITPLARQVAMERRVQLSVDGNQLSVSSKQLLVADQCSLNSDYCTVALGADHGGYELKESIKDFLNTAVSNTKTIDCGTHSRESVDYPDFAYAVARLVSEGQADCGIIVDGAGIGSCMVANKIPGVRAAMCYDQATAVNSREHNHANVLTLGAGLIGKNLAYLIVQTWLETDYGSGRHARRVKIIDQIGRRFSS